MINLYVYSLVRKLAVEMVFRLAWVRKMKNMMYLINQAQSVYNIRFNIIFQS